MTLRTRTTWILILAALSVVACASIAGAAGVRQGAPAMCAGPMGGPMPLGEALPHGGMHGHCGDWIAAAQPGLEEREAEVSLAGLPGPMTPAIPPRPEVRCAEGPYPEGVHSRSSLHHLAVLFLI